MNNWPVQADAYVQTFNRRDRNRLLRNGTISYKQTPQLLEVKASGKWGPKLEIRQDRRV